MNITQINLTIAQMLDYTTPILFAALCGVLSESAGVVNIGLDGIMRFGAFFGLLGAFFLSLALDRPAVRYRHRLPGRSAPRLHHHQVEW